MLPATKKAFLSLTLVRTAIRGTNLKHRGWGYDEGLIKLYLYQLDSVLRAWLPQGF